VIGFNGSVPAPDQALFRSVMGHFPSGVTVLTTMVGEQLHGMTVSAFCSVSLEPLLVLATIEKTTRMHGLLLESKLYGVSILGAKDEATSRFFADDRRLAGVEAARSCPRPSPSWKRGSRRSTRAAITRSSWAKSSMLKCCATSRR
jgi:flavin reductase (DIM6/NTAB) family NADH-FMN oxidoreductase RutF